MKDSQKTILWTAAGIAGIMLAKLITHKKRDFKLENRLCLVTGGSRGLGLEIARLLVKEKARVAICARDQKELRRAQSDLNELAATYGGNSVNIYTCDVTQADQVKQMLKQLRKKSGTIEVLINNAGVIQIAPAEVMDRTEYEEAMNLHFWAPYTLMEAVLPDMQKNRSGRIINIASLAGKLSVPHMAPYTASKHALVGLSEALHAEMQQYNIYITTVCPGLMRTGSVPQMIHKGQHRKEHAFAAIAASQPLTSMNAEDAAVSIVEAIKKGETSLVMPLQAKILTAMNGVFPGLLTDMMGLLNRFLPEADGIGHEQIKGRNSQSAWVPSILSSVTEKAAQRNNEL
jgi:short-subunit dehydrogenase